MDTLNVSLPSALKEYVQERVAKGGYGNTSEYVRELIRSDQKRQAREKLEALILEGINSGPASEMTDKDWARLRQRVVEVDRKRTK